MGISHAGAPINVRVHSFWTLFLRFMLIVLAIYSGPKATSAGEPYLVKDFTPGKGNTFAPIGTVRTVNVDGVLYFMEADYQRPKLWKTDGTTQGTQPLWQYLDFFPTPGCSIPYNGKLVFVADERIHGYELWSSNGTWATTQLIKDLTPGKISTFNGYSQLLLFKNNLYFKIGSKLWKTNGTPEGTVLVTDMHSVLPNEPSLQHPNILSLLSTGNKIVIVVNGVGEGWRAICTSDGTSSGTQFVAKFYPTQPLPSLPDDLVPSSVIGDKVFFALGSLPLRELWCFDINSGTVVLLGGRRVNQLAQVGNLLYFPTDNDTYGRELWETDGTPTGTKMAIDLSPGPTSSDIDRLTALGDQLIFSASVGTQRTLWKSDGTSEGTRVVESSTPFSDGSRLILNPFNLFATSQTLYFFANTSDTNSLEALWKMEKGSNGADIVRPNLRPPGNFPFNFSRFLFDAAGFGAGSDQTVYFGAFDLPYSLGMTPQLWRTDGTLSGTYSISRQLPQSSAIASWTDLHGELMLWANKQLWRSNGDTAGTTLLRDLYDPDLMQNETQYIATIANRIFFRTHYQPNGGELWCSDGSVPGTTSLTGKIYHGVNGPFKIAGDKLFFGIYGPLQGTQLWRTDGTPAGTSITREINPGNEQWTGMIRDVGSIGDNILFPVSNGVDQAALWKSDGSSSGTQPMLDIPGLNELGASFKGQIGGKEIFTMPNDQAAWALWSTNGEDSNTTKILGNLMLAPDDFRPTISNFQQMGGFQYFVATSESSASLYRTDGTAAGTMPVRNLGFGPFHHTKLSKLKDDILLINVRDYPLWRTDGTTSGTFMLNDAPALENSVFNLNPELALYFSGYSIWRTDGTTEGTALVKNLQAGPYFRYALVSGNSLYFTGTDDHGTELWHSDGTATGTGLVKDIYPGPYGSYPLSLTDVFGVLYFMAYDGLHGWELWRTLGTPGSTSMVADLAPGLFDSNPGQFKLIGDTFFFTATDQWNAGGELWAIKTVPGAAANSWFMYE